MTRDECRAAAVQLQREGRLTEAALQKVGVPYREVLPALYWAQACFVNVVHRAWVARYGIYREWRR